MYEIQVQETTRLRYAGLPCPLESHSWLSLTLHFCRQVETILIKVQRGVCSGTNSFAAVLHDVDLVRQTDMQ